MAGILFEDIFDVKDIDPEGKKFDRGEWGLRRRRPRLLGAAVPRVLCPPTARREPPSARVLAAPFPLAGAPLLRPLAAVWHRLPWCALLPQPGRVPTAPVRPVCPRRVPSLPTHTPVCSRALAAAPEPCAPLPWDPAPPSSAFPDSGALPSVPPAL